MQLKNVLVTGGCGLVGRTLAPLLRDQYAVTHFEMADPGDGLPFVRGDLRDAKGVAEVCRGMDAVLHIAGLHGRAWAAAGDDVGFEVNVSGTKNILEGAAKAGVKRVVFASSIWATGHGSPPASYLPIDEKLDREPAEIYGLTKALGERMCRYATAKHGISTIALRPGGIARAEAYRPDDVRYMLGTVDVRDVAQAFVLALEAPDDFRHEVFVVTADSPLCRVDFRLFRSDPALAFSQALPALAKAVAEGRVKLSASMEWYSVEKAKRLLGYRPQYNFRIE